MAGRFYAFIIASLALGGATTQGSAKDRPQLRLQPESAWNLDYADDSCRIARLFGSGEDKTAFYIERYEPGESFFLLVAGKPLTRAKRDKIVVQFGPATTARDQSVMPGTFGDFGPALMINNLSMVEKLEDTDANRREWAQKNLPAVRAPESEITWVAFTKTGAKDLVLELGPMDKPMEALRFCTDELLLHWGIDVEKHRSLTRKAAPSNYPENWVVSRDYPSKMLWQGQQSLVQFRLIVGADGTPEECHIQQSTRPKEFDDVVCEKVMMRAKFDPALDADGQPIKSYFRTSVQFQIPNYAR